MKRRSKEHRRRSIRLRGHDYSQAGAYYVTTCVQGRQCLFGAVEEEEMWVNAFGAIVEEWWNKVSDHFPTVALDTHVVMPNHFHGIIVLGDFVGAGLPRPYEITQPAAGQESTPSKGPTLGQVVAYFKYQATKFINIQRASPGVRLWQRGYYEHIVRDGDDLDRIRQYIYDNPANWETDEYYVLPPAS